MYSLRLSIQTWSRRKLVIGGASTPLNPRTTIGLGRRSIGIERNWETAWALQVSISAHAFAPVSASAKEETLDPLLNI